MNRHLWLLKKNAALGKLIDDCEVEVEESDIEKALQQQLQHISMETC